MTQIQNVIPAPMQEIHKSKWGYYPCDKATYQSLRRLNFLIEKTRHLAGSQRRWDRKTVNQGVKWIKVRDDQGRPCGWKRDTVKIEPPQSPSKYKMEYTGKPGRGFVIKLENGFERAAQMYREAKTPMIDQVPSFSASDLSNSTTLLGILESWFKHPSTASARSA